MQVNIHTYNKGDILMSTKITIREITLTPETDVEEFEEFVSEEASTFD